VTLAQPHRPPLQKLDLDDPLPPAEVAVARPDGGGGFGFRVHGGSRRSEYSHLARSLRYTVVMDTIEQVLANCEVIWPTACWQWRRAKSKTGYGNLWFGRRYTTAHRVIYKALVGPIPEGLDLDHLCRNRACCNPDHLEPVTRRENMRRGEPARRTHSPKGHAYAPENTRIIRHRGKEMRACKRCHCEQERARRSIRRLSQDT